MSAHAEVCERLRPEPRRFLVTGAAGFIGSHLVETLLGLDQIVVGLDNFSTGHHANLAEVLARVGPAAGARFTLIEGDVRDPLTCEKAVHGASIVFHEAALASVPRSMSDPVSAHAVNVDGFVNVLLAARAAGVERVVYASSSSVYGDDPSDVKTEERIGRPLSPYAATKLIDEVYAGTFYRTHGISSVGLRYFNVFGARQDPAGPYAAVIPRWIGGLLHDEPCLVFGDGSASRDFCYIDDVVQANLLAACGAEATVGGRVFNVACGVRTTLLELFSILRAGAARFEPKAAERTLRFEPPRAGDVPHSLAAIDRAHAALGYVPSFDVPRGMEATIAWYAARRLRSPAGTKSASPHAEQPVRLE